MTIAARVMLVGVLLVLASTAAGADDMTQSTYVELLRLAETDPDALEQLRRTTTIGGRPVDLSIVLNTDDPTALAARLSQLQSADERTSGLAPEPESDRLRASAATILEGDKFQPVPLPRPFRRMLRWLGDRLQPIGDLLANVFNRRSVQVIFAVVVVGGAALIARRQIARRARQDNIGLAQARKARVDDPDLLDRRADEAEAGGALEMALRLRFQAGIIRLELAERIHRSESSTTGELRRQLRSPHFDELANQVDHVTYGKRPVYADDLSRARSEWDMLLNIEPTELAAETRGASRR